MEAAVGTSDVLAGREKATLARQNGEDGVGVVIQLQDSVERLGDELAAKGIELLGPVQLRWISSVLQGLLINGRVRTLMMPILPTTSTLMSW